MYLVCLKKDILISEILRRKVRQCRYFAFRHMHILFTLATVAMLSELTDHQVALLRWMTIVYA